MPQLTVWNLKNLPLVEKPSARSQSLSVHHENLITTSWKIISTDRIIGNHSHWLHCLDYQIRTKYLAVTCRGQHKRGTALYDSIRRLD